MMVVINVKVDNIRRPDKNGNTYDNLKSWCDDTKNNYYIGRSGIVFIQENGIKFRYPPCNSVLHNPYKITNDIDRNAVCDLYRKYLEKKLAHEIAIGMEKNGPFHKAMRHAVGKQLGCWCAPERCHGHEIEKILASILLQDLAKDVKDLSDKITEGFKKLKI